MSNSISQSIELMMHRHTHLLECQRNFCHQSWVHVLIHAHTDFPSRSFRSLEFPGCFARAKIRKYSLDGLEKLSHLGQYEVTFRG